MPQMPIILGLQLGAFYRRMATPILCIRKNDKWFLACVAIASVLVCMLFVTKDVGVKLLPLGTQSELEAELGMLEGIAKEDTA